MTVAQVQITESSFTPLEYYPRNFVLILRFGDKIYVISLRLEESRVHHPFQKKYISILTTNLDICVDICVFRFVDRVCLFFLYIHDSMEYICSILLS